MQNKQSVLSGILCVLLAATNDAGETIAAAADKKKDDIQPASIQPASIQPAGNNINEDAQDASQDNSEQADEKIRDELKKWTDIARKAADELENAERRNFGAVKAMADEMRLRYKKNDAEIKKIQPTLHFDFQSMERWDRVAELQRLQIGIRKSWKQLAEWKLRAPSQGSQRQGSQRQDSRLYSKLADLSDDAADFSQLGIEFNKQRKRLTQLVRPRPSPFKQPLMQNAAAKEQALTFAEFFANHRQNDQSLFQIKKNRITDNRMQLSRFLALKWSQNQIAIDRSVWKPEVEPDMADLVAKSGLSQILVPPNGRSFQKRRRPPALPPVASKFDEVAQEVIPRSFGKMVKTTAEGYQMRSSTALNMQVRYEDDWLAFDLLEIQSENQVSLRQNQNGLTILLSTADQLLQFRQKQDGVRVLVDDGEKATTFQASNMVDLYRRQPEFVEGTLFKSLRQFGFRVPAGRFDARLVWTLIKMFQAESAKKADELMTVVRRLSENEFQARLEAQNQIAKNFYVYEAAIRSELENAKNYNYRRELSRLIASHQLRLGQYERLISKLDLGNNVEYLTHLVVMLTGKDKQIVVEKLERLTDQKITAASTTWKSKEWATWYDSLTTSE